MPVGQPAVPMQVAVGLWADGVRVIMLVVFIMNMRVVVFHRLVLMGVQVSLSEV